MAKSKDKPVEKPRRAAAAQIEKTPINDDVGAWSRTVRETVESVVIAFVLAFLFRTFEAEAFVIPTGSMATTLMGRHMDLKCPKCGFVYQVGGPDNDQTPADFGQITICPICGYRIDLTMSLKRGEIVSARNGRFAIKETDPGPPDEMYEVGSNASVTINGKLARLDELSVGDKLGFRADNAKRVVTDILKGSKPDYQYYNGDRILVNKFAFDFTAPKRWDVIVFKYPEDAKTNYIKRLIGLPGEVIRIRDGDIGVSNDGGKTFALARKDPAKLRAMLQIVYDNDFVYEPFLTNGWPARWKGTSGWSNPKRDDATPDPTVFLAEGKAASDNPADIAWLRYFNYVAKDSDWDEFKEGLPLNPSPPAQPIYDVIAYDEPPRLGRNYEIVSDLAVEFEVRVDQAAGKLVLELAKAGRPFECELDLASGNIALAIPGQPAGDQPRSSGGISRPGTYRLLFANVDHQLTLSIDNKPVQFDKPTTYNEFADERAADIQAAKREESPVQIGSLGAALRVSHLRVLRDIYYTFVRFSGNDGVVPSSAREKLVAAGTDIRPTDQYYFVGREGDGSVLEDQFFPLGDNSPSSADGRFWQSQHFVDRRLLVGKALFIYWPHSFDKIGSIPFPFFPNFGRMGFVR